ncbi:MAG: Asp-tRNA(Asn)/Glu-tRNA(Gln) amidotransferase subunit GatA [Spirochaetia bacterium]|nr:Asp-tRNA(Asn)/Glu-tRNA(Gln) amidotransferase subunit GatA [Spirochaetia bacterium]
MNDTLKKLSEKLNSKEINAVELTESYLKKIEEKDVKINSFIEVEKEEALRLAEESKKRREEGKALSDYDGIVIGIKDNILQKDRKSQAASKILEGFNSPYSATVIQKLQEKGLITLGRLNMDEFAMGSSTENSSIQTTKNPYDLKRAPGGSSGGSAASVAAGLVPVSLGSDTGGSIRQPAAFCGTVGLKPTYGTVSRYGLIAFASSLDQIGPLSNTVEDAEIIYNIIKGHDKYDSSSIPDREYKETKKSIEDIKIGYPPEMLEGISDEVKVSFFKVIEFLKKEICKDSQIKEINLPYQKYGVPVYYLTATSEASANLARFDGVRYGRRAPDAKNLEEVYELSRTEGFGSEVKRRILLGTYALSSGYYDAFYGKSQKLRKLIQEDYLKAFNEVDVIIIPTTPTPPFEIGEKTKDPVSMYLSDVLTVGASLAGIPALAVPAPFDKLPLSIQLQGAFFSEKLLFDLGRKIEQAFPAPPAVF